MTELSERFEQTKKRFDSNVKQASRNPEEVCLVAVSKFHSAEDILEIAKLGQSDFAENYVQEGVEKIEQLKPEFETLPQEIQWHFIGHIQSKKCKPIAQNFDWVHTIDSEKVAIKLDQHREGYPPLNVLIQLNLQGEETKSGILPDELEGLAGKIRSLDNLRLRGLMIIPEADPDPENQRKVFRQCKELMDDLNESGYNLDQLSMGMTNDMESAIAEGSTQVRIGTAIFGKRPPKTP